MRETPPSPSLTSTQAEQFLGSLPSKVLPRGSPVSAGGWGDAHRATADLEVVPGFRVPEVPVAPQTQTLGLQGSTCPHVPIALTPGAAWSLASRPSSLPLPPPHPLWILQEYWLGARWICLGPGWVQGKTGQTFPEPPFPTLSKGRDQCHRAVG